MQQKIILGIPGTWKDRSDFLQKFTLNNLNEYLFAGGIMQNMTTQEHCQVDIYDPNPNLKEAFEYAFEFNFDSPIAETELKNTLNQIEQHTMTIYLICDGGSYKNAISSINMAKAVLKAGGFAVKIETTGKAYTESQWSNISSNPSDLELSIIFSTFVHESTKFLFSCGMQNIGEKDVVVADTKLDVDAAFQLGSIFSAYMIDEKPSIQNGHSFSLDEESQHYIIKHSKEHGYTDKDDMFYNQLGYWVLEPKQINEEKSIQTKGWFGKLFG